MQNKIDIYIKSGSAEKQRDDAVILPLLEGRKLTQDGRDLQDHMTSNLLGNYLRRFDNVGKYGDISVLYPDNNDMISKRLIIIGVGDEKKLSLHKLRQLVGKLVKNLDNSGVRDASLYLTGLNIQGVNNEEKVQAITEGALLGLYRFDNYKNKKTQDEKRPLRSLTIMLPTRTEVSNAQCAVDRGIASATGVCFARDLANEPGNVCTPEWLANQASGLADEYNNLTVDVMDKVAIAAKGFRGLLAVNQGSEKEPRMIRLQYNGADSSEPLTALVGKGLTFDSGGISLKPGRSMDEMKFDMCGAATVLGIFKAVCALELPINLLGVIASTENMPGTGAYKPSDIIKSYEGTTIEVLNTDAEGRIILADALAYAAEHKPANMIDFATLTGACVVALGGHASGLLGNNDDLQNQLVRNGERTHDYVWRLPMFDEYQKHIDSKIADIKNIGDVGAGAGTITAACFLSRFVGETSWAHLDIAGTAWVNKDNDLCVKGATGSGVRVILDYLIYKPEVE
ncbi:MAG: leucyl aminopeptidase [Mariprofundales bacterium]